MAYKSWAQFDKLAAADLNDAFGTDSWTAFTPTLNSGTLTLGTGGTSLGRYMQIGKTVFYRIRWTFGTGTIAQSGLVFTLPVTALQESHTPMGQLIALDSSASTYYLGAAITVTGLLIPYMGAGASAMTALSATVPFTIASGDTFTITGTYTAA